MRAYTACIIANIAFLEPGQERVLTAGGVEPLLRLLKAKEDKKVTLHSTAAVQNLTYKNTRCCSEVLELNGEKTLKKLLQHKSDDVQQFAAGALANLQLYRRKAGLEQPASSALPARASPGGTYNYSPPRKGFAKLLRKVGGKKGNGDSTGSHGFTCSSYTAQDAARTIQACYRGWAGRREFELRRKGAARKGNKYEKFSIADARAELSGGGLGALPPLAGGLRGLAKRGGAAGMLPPPGRMGAQGMGSGLDGPSGFAGVAQDTTRKPPQRLAPLGPIGGRAPLVAPAPLSL